jgi:hypothetical protein
MATAAAPRSAEQQLPAKSYADAVEEGISDSGESGFDGVNGTDGANGDGDGEGANSQLPHKSYAAAVEEGPVDGTNGEKSADTGAPAEDEKREGRPQLSRRQSKSGYSASV